MDVTDEQWAMLEPLIPVEERQPSGRGRPWRLARDVFNSILWILQTGARWQDLPARYPPYQTVHRRFSQWGYTDQNDMLRYAYRSVPALDRLTTPIVSMVRAVCTISYRLVTGSGSAAPRSG